MLNVTSAESPLHNYISIALIWRSVFKRARALESSFQCQLTYDRFLVVPFVDTIATSTSTATSTVAVVTAQTAAAAVSAAREVPEGETLNTRKYFLEDWIEF